MPKRRKNKSALSQDTAVNRIASILARNTYEYVSAWISLEALTLSYERDLTWCKIGDYFYFNSHSRLWGIIKSGNADLPKRRFVDALYGICLELDAQRIDSRLRKDVLIISSRIRDGWEYPFTNAVIAGLRECISLKITTEPKDLVRLARQEKISLEDLTR